jgi:hypothetical protein
MNGGSRLTPPEPLCRSQQLAQRANHLPRTVIFVLIERADFTSNRKLIAAPRSSAPKLALARRSGQFFTQFRYVRCYTVNMRPPLNIKRIGMIVAAVAVLMMVAGSIYVGDHSPHPAMSQYSKVLAAANAYSISLKNQGLWVPASVTLQELGMRGFLQPSDVAGFEGMQVTISLRPDESQPQDALMRVRLPDGQEVVALGDGSVQH